ncbi:MAG: F0F1 ATP synthase subunit epsilon [Phycisphaerales bacterium]|nr:F0F1 ATP synthase subunit epsilon [Phycisphaerales bacterium]
MTKTFRCAIVTPTEAVLDTEVSYVTFPAWDGQTGIMAGRSPFLARLGLGPVRLDFADGGSRWFLIDGGFAQMQEDTLSLLTEYAVGAESLNVPDAERELGTALKAPPEGVGREQADRQTARVRAKLALARSSAGRPI